MFVNVIHMYATREKEKKSVYHSSIPLEYPPKSYKGSTLEPNIMIKDCSIKMNIDLCTSICSINI